MVFKKYGHEWVFAVDSDDILKNQCVGKVSDKIVELTEECHSIKILQIDKRGNNFPSLMNSYTKLMNSELTNDNVNVFRKSSLMGFGFPEFKG